MGKKAEKDKKPKKQRYGIRMICRIIQHVMLAVMALALVVTVASTTVRIEGFRSNGSYTSYTHYAGKEKNFEDSELFNTIFGYAMADVIRLGVVSSQLETEEVFDGGKVVDVTAYNCRDIGLPEQYVTANYYLEDLLKWANYGFEYIPTDMTREQADNFLAPMTKVTTMDSKSKYYNTSDASYLKSDIQSYTFVSDVSANQIFSPGSDEGDGFVSGYQPVNELNTLEETKISEVIDSVNEDGVPIYTYNVMVNRYKTVEDKNLEEYVSDWTLYGELCANVERAAENLAYNYNEYVDYREYYSAQNSNVRYLIAKTVGDEVQYYSNMEAESSYREWVLEMMETFAEPESSAVMPHEKFVYYSPSEMIYKTNTNIAESTIRKILQEYDYAYPETVKIWINVDTSYPVKDAFTQGAEYMPYRWQWTVVFLTAAILYLLLFLYQTMVTGRYLDEEGNRYTRLGSFDKVPTEAALFIAAGVAVLVIWVMIVVTQMLGVKLMSLTYCREAIHEDWFKALILGSVFVADVIFTFFFYSLVRRVKARTLWKNSYLYRLLSRAKKFAWNVYDNGNVVIRTWVPYGIFLGFNLFMVLWSVSAGNLFILFIAVAVDILVGILIYKDTKERQGIVKGIETIASGEINYQIHTGELHGDNLTLANSVNSIGKGIKEAVEISMKDERMKADLITNVSHDIKTPLTSIINYVDLLKREQVDNKKIQNYIRVLDEKSQRLKQLTDDLVEASKITSGNISLNFERINLTELMNQTIGEFSEKFEQKGLTTVMNVNTQEAVIEADSRRIWRVMENLFNNIYKYAMTGTRVYVSIDGRQDASEIVISIKNISATPLNCNPEELTERFIRGDVSRTTEGSGLGLSIAKNLTVAQKGAFEIQLDGDLFKVLLTFPVAKSLAE